LDIGPLTSHPDLFDTPEAYARKRDDLAASFRAQVGVAALGKKTSNLFRPRDPGAVRKLEVGSLNRTISVDPDHLVAEVEGMTTFEDFTDACLVHGTAPTVVPELKTITVGGAITGIGIESSSFRHGFVHEAVVEMDVLCGDGVVRTCRRDNEFADLFFAIPNSYGTLGYVLRARLHVVRAAQRVVVRHRRIADRTAFLQGLAEACRVPGTDFVEGVAFAPGDYVLTTARFEGVPGPVSDYTGMTPYHTTLRKRETDALTARDWLWRWDPDWFWCSRTFGMENPVLRFLLGRWMLRSSAYWKILTYYRKWRIEERVHRIKRFLKIPIALREPVIQDVEIPIENASEFLDFYQTFIDIRPCWVCPVVPQPSEQSWSLYPMETGRLHLNFGFWDSVATKDDRPSDHFNRLLEREVVRLGGRKSLYSSVHFPEDEFWQIHDQAAYRALKAKYDPGARFRDLWVKVVKGK